MISIGICTVILITSTCYMQVKADPQFMDLTPLAATCSPETVVQVFSSTLAINLISTHDPEFLFGMTLHPVVAAEQNHNAVFRIFDALGFSNAQSIASTAYKHMSLADDFTFMQFFQNVGNTTGNFLAERGFLDCDNVIQRSSQFATQAERVFRSLPAGEFESLVAGFLMSFENILEEVGYSLEENEKNWQALADAFYR